MITIAVYDMRPNRVEFIIVGFKSNNSDNALHFQPLEDVWLINAIMQWNAKWTQVK
jgi:hypothetical protein